MTILAQGRDEVLAFIIEPVMGFCGGADHAPPPITAACARSATNSACC
jgi:adenosylmethionine-8-amino-7-oxononanoate aminotransferase